MAKAWLIPHSLPTLGDQERQAVLDVLASGQLTQGPKCAELERALAGATGVSGAAACSSGLAALHLAMLAMGVGEGDEVILPTYVCEALLDAVLYTRATPVIVDVDPRTGNIDPAAAARARTARTRLIVVPHMFGLPARMDELQSLGVPLLEDCAMAIGASYAGRPAGSIGQASVVSLYATKMICAGEGGAVCSDNARVIAAVADLRDYGGRQDFRIRFNYKLTDVAAAMGTEQVRRLGEFVARRRQLARLYDALLADVPEIERPDLSKQAGSVFYRYVVKVPPARRSAIREFLADRGIQCGLGVLNPLHRLTPQYAEGPCPVGEEWSQRSLSLPIYPLLKEEQAETVVESLKEALQP